MLTNTIQHYLSRQGIRLTVADTTGAACEAEMIHHLPPVSAAILAKIMTGTALMTNDFKNHEGVSFKWITGSELGNIHADAYEGHFVRGFLDHPESGENIPADTAHEADLVSRKGQLFVTRYSLLKLPYTSAVNLGHGDIAACLTEYLNTSEQTLSALSLSVKLGNDGKIIHSAGFLAQLMPGGNLAAFAQYFRDLDEWDLSAPAEDPHSLAMLLTKGGFEILQESPVSFRCTCSEERIRASLLSLPEGEKEALLQDPSLEVVCHYCGKKYTISRGVLGKWFEDAKGARCQ